MEIREAVFVSSNTTLSKCPAPVLPEYAFIGRSNVGKSSLINMLTSRKGLAKISATPGKTQLINHFLVNKKWYLVDLPGYGFARVSKKEKAGWDKMIKEYFEKRANLMTAFVLVDIRLEPQTSDLNFIRWLGEKQVPLAIVFTKSDKLSSRQEIYSVELFKKALRKDWEELPLIFITSSEKKKGREELLSFIDTTNKVFKRP